MRAGAAVHNISLRMVKPNLDQNELQALQPFIAALPAIRTIPISTLSQVACRGYEETGHGQKRILLDLREKDGLESPLPC